MKSSRIYLIALILAAGVSASVIANHEWLWMDECFTVLESIGQIPFVVQEPFARTFDSREFWTLNDMAGVRAAILAGDNGNQSIYIFLIHVLVRVFGTDRPAVLFAPSILGYLMGIVWCYRLGRLSFSDRVGLIAAFLFASHMHMVEFAVELRAYSLAVFFSLVATECFVRIVGLDKSESNYQSRSSSSFWAFMYALSAIMALFLHYLSGLILLGHVIYAVLAVRDRRVWMALLTVGAVVILIFLPIRSRFLMSQGYSTVDRYNAHIRRIGILPLLARSPWGFFELVRNTLHALGGLLPWTDLSLTAAIPFAAILVGLRNGRNRIIQSDMAHKLGFIAILAAILPAAAAVGYFTDLSIMSHTPRYQIFSIPFYAILVAYGLECLLQTDCTSKPASGERGSRTTSRLTFAIYLIAFGANPVLSTMIALVQPHENEYFIRAREIAARADRGEVRRIEVPSILDCQMISFYLGPNRSIPIAATDTERTNRISRKLDEMKLSHPLCLFSQTYFEYLAEGSEYSKFEVESDADGVLRLGYATRKGP